MAIQRHLRPPLLLVQRLEGRRVKVITRVPLSLDCPLYQGLMLLWLELARERGWSPISVVRQPAPAVLPHCLLTMLQPQVVEELTDLFVHHPYIRRCLRLAAPALAPAARQGLKPVLQRRAQAEPERLLQPVPMAVVVAALATI